MILNCNIWRVIKHDVWLLKYIISLKYNRYNILKIFRNLKNNLSKFSTDFIILFEMIEKFLSSILYVILLINVGNGQNVTDLSSTVATTTTTLPVKTYSDGAYRLDWIEGIDYIDFDFTTVGQAQENTYSAFGLSLDDQMVNFLTNEF